MKHIVGVFSFIVTFTLALFFRVLTAPGRALTLAKLSYHLSICENCRKRLHAKRQAEAGRG